MFCQKQKHKGTKSLTNVTSFDACKAIVAAAEARGDQTLLTNIQGAHDLIAAEAKYHSACRGSYVSKSNLKYQGFKEENECLYEKSFLQLVEDIESGITEGKAYDMAYLLMHYKSYLFSNGVACETYRSEKLKKRLIAYFSDSIVFHKQPDPSKPELVYSSNLSVQNIINAAASHSGEKEYDYRQDEKASGNATGTDSMKVLFQAAQILKTDIKDSKGISIQPLSVDDVSLERGRKVLPDSLYTFLRWLLCQQIESKNEEDERRAIMIGQDIVHSCSRSRVKTPKHVGLAVTLHHLTGSKQLIQLLNKMGHCSSYNEVEIVNTSLAKEISARSEANGVVVPSNISPGTFVQFAADNNDLNEETIDGKQTTHATTVVAYQRVVYGPKPPTKSLADHKSRKRSIDASLTIQRIDDFGVHGKRPSVTSLLGKVQDEDYQMKDEQQPQIDIHDFSWFLLRVNKGESPFYDDPQTNETQQSIPGWSPFNALVSTVTEHLCTNIGYCPILQGSPTEYSTVYTVLKNVQSISSSLGQTTSVVTFDLDIYAKAKEIQWRRQDEFKHLVIRMGGFHIATNFLSIIGKKFQNSGIEELLTESGLYGSATTTALLKGKSYNRGVRAHKLIMEALMRLQWAAFCQWLKSLPQQEESVDVKEIEAQIMKCKAKMGTDQVKQEFEGLCRSTAGLNCLFRRFQLGLSSQLGMFWNSYIKMVQLLLQFIRAEREGNWELHLQTTAAMIPHFFSMDRHNYSRWLPVYLADMRQLKEEAPEVHDEFVQGNHPVSRSSQPFNQIWTDMALEQTINRDSKTKGGIVGISQKPGALERWFLTAHERAAITTSTKDMCHIKSHQGAHKEGGKARIARDEQDVENLVSTIKSIMTNPFEAEDDESDIPLSNLITGVVLPTDMASRLINAEDIGRKEAAAFVDHRINSNALGFWEPIHKLNICTFSELVKKAKVKSSKEKLTIMNFDRNILGRLLVASKTRPIDLREVLKYELSPVPWSLAHPDGTLRKSTKSVLLNVLEAGAKVLPRLPYDDEEPMTAYVIDGMAMIQMVKTAGASTFGDLAKQYFKSITSPLGHDNCNRVDVVFDRYDKQDSIKESERHRRSSSSAGYEVKINGPNTPIPKKWNAYISNPNNKIRLQRFLSAIWIELRRNMLAIGHRLVLAGCFTNPDDVFIVERGTAAQRLLHLTSDHEEADTRLMLHAQDCALLYPRIVIHTPDTDVVVLAIYVCNKLQSQQLWIKTGVKDKLRFIPVHEIAENLGSLLCSMLPAFHALTGCDTTSGPYLVGKKRSFEVLKKNANTYAALSNLGDDVDINPEVSKVAEKFICLLYSSAEKAGTTGDEVRYWMFCQRKPRSKGLPPTTNSIYHHIERANYQAMVWQRCLQPMQQLPSPLGNGWEMTENQLKPVLMSQDAAPEGLSDLTMCTCKKSACKSNVTCACRSNELPCTEGCGCMADDSCLNPHNLMDSDDESCSDESSDDDSED